MSKTQTEKIQSSLATTTANNVQNGEDKQYLEDIENAFERMSRSTQQAPYLLTTPSDRPYRTPQAQQNNWRAYAPFEQDEEHLQYATFLYRESQDSLFVLKTAHEEELRQKEKRLGVEGLRSQASTPLHSSTPKKKISLSAYKKTRLNGQVSSHENSSRPPSRNGDFSTHHVDGKPIAQPDTTNNTNTATTANTTTTAANKITSAQPNRQNPQVSQNECKATREPDHLHPGPREQDSKQVVDESDSGGSVKSAFKFVDHDLESPRKRLRLSSPQAKDEKAVKSQRDIASTSSKDEGSMPKTQTVNLKSVSKVQLTKANSPINTKNAKQSISTHVKVTAPSPPEFRSDAEDSGTGCKPNTLPSWLPDLSDSQRSTETPPKNPGRLSNTLPPWIPHPSRPRPRDVLPPKLEDLYGDLSGYHSPSAGSQSSSSQSEPLRNRTTKQPPTKAKPWPSGGAKKEFERSASDRARSSHNKIVPPRQSQSKSRPSGKVQPEANLSETKQESGHNGIRKEQTSTSSTPSPPSIRTIKVHDASTNMENKTKASYRDAQHRILNSVPLKTKEDQLIVKLQYRKSRLKETDIATNHSQRGKPTTHTLQAGDAPSHSFTLSVSKGSTKRPLEDNSRVAENTPSKKHKSGDISIVDSPRTPLLSSNKSPSVATPSTSHSRNAVAGRAENASDPWINHAEKLQRSGQILKRSMQSFLKTRREVQAEAADGGDAIRAAVQGIESVLCYIQAFTCLEEAKQKPLEPWANWKSLDPLAAEVCHACSNFPHLHGFSLFLRSICCQMTLNGYTKAKPGSLLQSTAFVNELLRFQDRATRLSHESEGQLSRKVLMKFYPSTHNISQSLPLGMITSSMTVVRMGGMFLQEWTKRKDVDWSPRLEEGICSQL